MRWNRTSLILATQLVALIEITNLREVTSFRVGLANGRHLACFLRFEGTERFWFRQSGALLLRRFAGIATGRLGFLLRSVCWLRTI